MFEKMKALLNIQTGSAGSVFLMMIVAQALGFDANSMAVLLGVTDQAADVVETIDTVNKVGPSTVGFVLGYLFLSGWRKKEAQAVPPPEQ